MYRQDYSRSRENTRSASSISERSLPRGRSRGQSQERYGPPPSQPYVMGPHPGMMMGPPPGAMGPYQAPPEPFNGPHPDLPPEIVYGPPPGAPIRPQSPLLGPPDRPTEFHHVYPRGPEGIPLDPLGRPMGIPVSGVYGPPGPVMHERILINGARREPSREKGGRGRKKQRDGSPRKQHRSKSRGRQGDPLDQWAEWRRQMNESLSADLTENRYRQIEVGDDFHNLTRPSAKPGKGGVYRYSTTIDQGTALHKEDYIAFGIPRIQLGRERGQHKKTKSPAQRRRRSPSSSQSDGEETDRRTNETPYYTITKIKDHEKAKRIQQHMPQMYYASNGDLDFQNGYPGMEKMHADHPSTKGSRGYRNGFH